MARIVVGALSIFLLLGCALPLPTPDTSSPPTVTAAADDQTSGAEDVTVNVAAMARLGETTQIEIERFVETPSAGYESVAVIDDVAVISAIVDTLDAALALQPRAMCVETYHLRFVLESGATHTFGYLCEGSTESVLRGDVPFLAESDVRPPDQLLQIIEQQVRAE
ncbi:MAG: hypothetical protein R2873_03275 [Caldilineaceae bacterium]